MDAQTEGVGAVAAATRADRRVPRADAVEVERESLPTVEDRTAGVLTCEGAGIADESLSFCFFFAGPDEADVFKEPDTVRRPGVVAPLGRVDAVGAGVVARPTTDGGRGRCAACYNTNVTNILTVTYLSTLSLGFFGIQCLLQQLKEGLTVNKELTTIFRLPSWDLLE